MLKIENKIEFGIDNLMWVGEVLPTFNQSEEHRYGISDLASVCKGHFHSNNPEKRFKMLMVEGANKTPTTPIEFIPMLDIKKEQKLINNVENLKSTINKNCGVSSLVKLKGEYKTARETLATFYKRSNLRAYSQYGINFYNTLKEVKDFKIIIGYFPYFVWMHLRTHRAFSFMIETGRKSVMSELLYPTQDKHYANKKELTRLRLGVMGGWKQDEETWNNLIATRSSKDTQQDTKLSVEQIKVLVK